VKELHEAAATWQHDVSNVTKLSLKGVKRRSKKSISPVPSGQPTDVARTADQSNVAELSNDPILLEVRQQCFLSPNSEFVSLLILSFVLLQGLHATRERNADNAVRNKCF
jgi:hypothetical protein